MDPSVLCRLLSANWKNCRFCLFSRATAKSCNFTQKSTRNFLVPIQSLEEWKKPGATSHSKTTIVSDEMSHRKYSGYATFSEFIGSYPELAIYWYFLASTSRSLLYQQSDLLPLEHRFRECDDGDDGKGGGDLDALLSSSC